MGQRRQARQWEAHEQARRNHDEWQLGERQLQAEFVGEDFWVRLMVQAINIINFNIVFARQ